MTPADLPLTLAALRAAYRERRLTPRQLVKALDSRGQALAAPGVWTHRLAVNELAPYLQRLEAAEPGALPLYGVPFAIKDNIDLAQVPTTAACPAAAYTPTRSAFVVQRLIDAGALPMGKDQPRSVRHRLGRHTLSPRLGARAPTRLIATSLPAAPAPVRRWPWRWALPASP